jgi:hypothetical protein
VSVPTNEQTDKLRTCEYTVVEHYGDYSDIYQHQESDRLLVGALYTTQGQRVEPNQLREDVQGMFDNASGDHWDAPSNAPYLSMEEDEEEDDYGSCDDCGADLDYWGDCTEGCWVDN